MPVPAEAVSALLPLLITAPLYILGRKIWFKSVPQSQMHTIMSGKIFTLIIGLVHITLTVVAYMILFL